MALKSNLQWKNGKRDGVSKRWYKSGKDIFDYLMKDGEPVEATLSFYENGNLNHINDKNKSGIIMAFYENGRSL